jgi:hypothetical protein
MICIQNIVLDCTIRLTGFVKKDKYSNFENKSILLEIQAEVAELVDALGSGSSRETPVGVRVSPSAP